MKDLSVGSRIIHPEIGGRRSLLLYGYILHALFYLEDGGGTLNLNARE
jgi:hypothetical protein